MFPKMGVGTVSEKEASIPRRPRRTRKRGTLSLQIDVPLLLVTATLAIFGLLMVYSASWDYSLENFDSPTFIISRQMMWLGLGIVVLAALIFIDYHFWLKMAIPIMIVTVLALLAVLLVGDERHGATRTLFGGSIQPSELAKLALIIYLTVWLQAHREEINIIGFGLLPLGAILGGIGGMIFIQPDLSATLTIFFLGGTLFFLAGGDLRQIGVLIVIAALVGWLVVLMSATGADRVSSYWAGLKDLKEASYHVQRSLGAFINGKWFGVGIGNGQAKVTGLPVPPTDSVFAVVGEETGVFGATALVGLYLLLLWRGLSISRRAPDDLGAILAAGLTLWLVMEAMVNMAAMLNLLPFAGNELPFISSGGSNLMVSLISIGILMNIGRQSTRQDNDFGRHLRAIINLRGRDRRGRVSRARRTSGSSQS